MRASDSAAETRSSEIMVEIGTIFPEEERTLARPMSEGSDRNLASACMTTRYVLPFRVKSLM